MEITLQDLLEVLASEGGDLSAWLREHTDNGDLTTEQATALRTEAHELFNTLRNSEDFNPARDLAQLESITEAAERLTAEIEHLDEVSAQQAEQVAELARRAGLDVSGSESPAEGDSDGGEDADGTEDAPEEGDGGGEGVDVANAPVVDLTEETPAEAAAPTEQLAASGETPAQRQRARVNVAAVARRTQRTPVQIVPSSGSDDLPFSGALVASAEAPGMRAGTPYDSWLSLGRVAANAFGSKSQAQLQSIAASAQRSGTPYIQRDGLAEFRKVYPADLIADMSDDTEVLNRAVDQSRLPGGSLLAAGGWCSPSETMYDLCELPCSMDGILSLPEIGAPRGGVRWTKGLDFCEIYNAPGYFHFTEAQMMADPRPEKPCMEIPCPDFDECRLDVDGLCVTADVMMSRTYPEVIAQFLQGAMCAHAHRINALKIADILAGSTDDGTIGMTGLGATANLLYAIELEIQAYRYRGRRAQEGSPALLELVAPYWIKGIVRADIANRNAPSGIGNPLAVSDAEIVQWFASRGVAVRFVYDWQNLIDCNPSDGDVNRPVTDYPDSVEFILYEAGTWVAAGLDVITLENLYDSTLIRQNKFTALFTEEAFCIINRCNGSRRFSVDICPNGNTGLQVQAVCAAGPAAPTGATAGTPGTFTPAGSSEPYSLADLAGVTASPATAWTTGQYIQLGDGTDAYWNGTAWVAGIAA